MFFQLCTVEVYLAKHHLTHQFSQYLLLLTTSPWNLSEIQTLRPHPKQLNLNLKKVQVAQTSTESHFYQLPRRGRQFWLFTGIIWTDS